eukprot:Gregarina_sp_Poly_1__2397@NODE_1641_length_3643_cov_244_962808_g1082_i0_p2_GENE_NODE_1641_length_3643_cov_244_962808_g1082_i0NODE_1641_length_3643_cov_244_962808_g1082_i0_p2_ORF_typecomplete_len368_score38_12IF4E/PF01652_18/6_3e29_NODE_1641_length_3643_cov_244_962808_g1082_i01121104
MTDNLRSEKVSDKQTDFSKAAAAGAAADSHHQLETEWTAWTYPRVTGSKIAALCHQRLAQDGADLKDLSPASAAANLYARDLNVRAHFSTVEGFFHAWDKQQKPSEMPSETNLAIFRGHLKPMWEAFPSGGRFVLRLRRPSATAAKSGSRIKVGSENSLAEQGQRSITMGSKDPVLAEFVNRLWENLVFRLIGESFELPELVGAVCSMRAREVVFSLWVTNAENIALRNKIRDHLKKLIEESQSSCESQTAVLVQFNAFHARLREQQRDILAKVTRSRQARYGTSTAESGSVCTALEFSKPYSCYSVNVTDQQNAAASAEPNKFLVAADC